MARMLNTYVLVQESPLDWGAEFRALGPVYSPHVIYGLVPLGRGLESWAGWTDADLKIEQHQHRVSVPILAEGPRRRSDRTFTPEEMRFLFVPQLLDKWEMAYTKVRAVALGPWISFPRDLPSAMKCFWTESLVTTNQGPEKMSLGSRLAGLSISLT